ncbi:MAG: ABC transporter permease, partial [Candidatus Acidiferrales bacterium]
MFKRLLFHLLRGNRVRLTVALLALISGGAVVSALLNLDLDINHKLTQEFRSLGANVVISAPQTSSVIPDVPPLMDESVVQDIEKNIDRQSPVSGTGASPDLYVVARAGSKNGQNVVVTGTWLDHVSQMEPWWKIAGTAGVSRTDLSRCLIGRNVSRSLSLSTGGNIALSYQGRSVNLTVAGVADAGASEDNQIFVNLPVAQKLAGLDGKIELIQLSIPGSVVQ